jgi:SLIT-ROBO Rho GTPase activating protein
MHKVIGSLDSRRDKKHFLERNDQAFMIPKKFEYQPVRRDETEAVQKPVLEDLESRKVKLGERLGSLRAESEEIWKSLEAAEKTLLEMVNCADYDTTRYQDAVFAGSGKHKFISVCQLPCLAPFL